jgi:hypothetical protein
VRKETNFMNIFFGGFGSDAGGWYWDGHRFKRVPGWNPEALAELGNALTLIRAAGRLKAPGVGEAAAKAVTELVQKELGDHLKEGGVLVIG